MITESDDLVVIPCAQCCRKHLSAAIAHYVDIRPEDMMPSEHWRVLFGRALINWAESKQGCASRLHLAVGLIARAEMNCPYPNVIAEMSAYRLSLSERKIPAPRSGKLYPSDTEMYLAYVDEAEREYPAVRTAVNREQFYRNNMNDAERRQAAVRHRLAQLRWLDENVFGRNAAKKKKRVAVKPAPRRGVKDRTATSFSRKGAGK